MAWSIEGGDFYDAVSNTCHFPLFPFVLYLFKYVVRSYGFKNILYLMMQLFHMQKEYIRGISAWNFNLEDLKNQAALVSIFTFLFCLIYLFELDGLVSYSLAIISFSL